MCNGASYTDKYFAFNSSFGYTLVSGFIFLFILYSSVLWSCFLDEVSQFPRSEDGLELHR